MRKEQVNKILINQSKRRKKIINSIITIGIFVVIFANFLLLYIINSKPREVGYNEQSNLDYKVYLKENDYFKESYLEKDKQYIANLIDYIEADFNYNLEIEENDILYEYAYSIEANVVVKEKDSLKDLYNYKEELYKEDYKESNSSTIVTIDKKINIDYNKYNNIIKSFVEEYGLENIESKLYINMIVSVNGNCEDIKDANTGSVITLAIPLTTNTIGIDMTYDLVDEDIEKTMICEDANSYAIIYLILSIVFLIIDIIFIFNLIIYMKNTRTAENIYQKELKKILNTYGSYIQKVNNDFSLRGYQVLHIASFTDLLEIRDTISSPILMVEEKDKKGVYFIIPSNTKILYTYGFKISDIKKELENDISKEK